MAVGKTSAVRRILVVGQGIAGTLVGFEAMRRGLHVTTIDRGSHCASQVAAGLYNPMSFRRLIPTWDAEVHLETMRETIGAMEALLGITVLHPTPMWKVLPNAEVAVDWRVKAQSNPMMGPVIPAPEGVMAPHGIGVVEDAGWVNLPLLLDAWRLHLQRSDVDSNFVAVDLADFDASGGLHDFDVRVDCRGVAVREDAGLAHLEVAAYQGEVLTLKGDAGPGATLNCGKWLLPIGGGLFKLGASYDWNNDALEISAAVRETLLEKMEAAWPAVRTDFEVVAHSVGLRPVARDRRPVVGQIGPGRYVFNGLGTRGVLIAPRWAAALLDNILTGTPLPTTVQAGRFA
jgi:glycine oxidase